jgi:hypothetical protein
VFSFLSLILVVNQKSPLINRNTESELRSALKASADDGPGQRLGPDNQENSSRPERALGASRFPNLAEQ